MFPARSPGDTGNDRGVACKMQVDIRPTRRLATDQELDVGRALTPVLEAMRAREIDLDSARIVCDWIQYRNNFRSVVDARAILPGEGVEVAVDLRRVGDVDLVECTTRALATSEHDHVALEDWCPGRASCIWDFNQLYWAALGHWERVTGQEYERTLPGGESDARNVAAVGVLLDSLFAVWDDLAARNALPEELYVLELGVGNGNQAKTFLDEFRRRDQDAAGGYYRRLHYLMGDYSPDVLQRAERRVADHAPHTSSLILDATHPAATLGFLRHKAFLIYISNVYDNLPTDEIARISGSDHLVEVRAIIPGDAADQLSSLHGVPRVELPELVRKLLRLGPELLSEAFPARFGKVDDAVRFWVDTWDAVRLQERYVPLPGLDSYHVCPSVSGEFLRPFLEANGDTRFHVSNGAVSSFSETIDLLHPYGQLICHDLFVDDPRSVTSVYRGPGKYDGSVVNWVNGPLIQHLGRRRGLDASLSAFEHRAGSKVVTLTARVAE